jgi:hypothetical protein
VQQLRIFEGQLITEGVIDTLQSTCESYDQCGPAGPPATIGSTSNISGSDAQSAASVPPAGKTTERSASETVCDVKARDKPHEVEHQTKRSRVET